MIVASAFFSFLVTPMCGLTLTDADRRGFRSS